jgi:hypothetical protein
VALPARVEASGILRAARTDQGHVWAAVRVQVGTDMALARMRMNDGRIETGPAAGAILSSDGAWVFAERGGGLAMIHLLDARTRIVALKDVKDVDSSIARLPGDRSVLLGPAAGRYLEVSGPVDDADERGCALVATAAGDRGIGMGPWRRVCP